jgi:hypothetical protein
MVSTNNPTEDMIKELIASGDLDPATLEQDSPFTDLNTSPDIVSYRIPSETARKIAPTQDTAPAFPPSFELADNSLRQQTAVSPSVTPPVEDEYGKVRRLVKARYGVDLPDAPAATEQPPEEPEVDYEVVRQQAKQKYGIDLPPLSSSFTSSAKAFGRSVVESSAESLLKGPAEVGTFVANSGDINTVSRAQSVLDAFDKLDEDRLPEGTGDLSFEAQNAIYYYNKLLNDPSVPLEDRISKKEQLREKWAGKLLSSTSSVEGAAERLQENPLMQAGERVDEWKESSMPMTEEEQGRTSSKLAGAIGSAVPMLATGVAGSATRILGKSAITRGAGSLLQKSMVPQGMVSQASIGYDDAIESGASPSQALTSSGANFLIGASEGVPIGRGIERGLDAAKDYFRMARSAGLSVEESLPGAISYYGKAIALQAAEEGAQEGGSQAASNYVASDIAGYDPDRNILEGTGEGAATGGAVGGLFGAVGAFAGRRIHKARTHAQTGQPLPGEESEDPATPPPPPGAPGQSPAASVDIIPEDQLEPDVQDKIQSIDDVINPPSEKYPTKVTIPNPEVKLPPVTQQEIDDLVFDEIPSEAPTAPEEPQVIPQIDAEGNTVGQSYFEPDTQYSEPITPERTLQDIIASRKPVRANTAEDVAIAGVRAATSPLNDQAEPTEAQKREGNYKKAHINVQGLNITLENPRGSTRSGMDEAGNPWSTTMEHDYGYIKGTTGKDGEHVDTYIGPEPQATTVYVFDTKNPTTGKFDEAKVFIGFKSREEADVAFGKAYPGQAAERFMGAAEMDMPQFKRWVKSGRARQPITKQPKPTAAAPNVAVNAPVGQQTAQVTTQKPQVAPPSSTAPAIEQGQQKSLEVMKQAVEPQTPGPVIEMKQRKRPTGKGKPKDLLRFIASIGGIQDERGDLRDLRDVFIPGHGKLIRDNGVQADYAREAAQEAGYEGAEELSTFYEALYEARRGKAHYSSRDQGRGVEQDVTKMEAAKSNPLREAVYQQAENLGIDAVGKSAEDLAVEIAERESIQADGAHSEEAMEEIASQAQDYLHAYLEETATEYDSIEVAEESDIPWGDENGRETETRSSDQEEGISRSEGEGQEPDGGAEEALPERDQDTGVRSSGGEESGAVRQQPEGEIEQTAAGEQRVIAGASKITQKEQAARGAEKPLKAKVAQKGMQGATNLFDQSENQEQDLFREPTKMVSDATTTPATPAPVEPSVSESQTPYSLEEHKRNRSKLDTGEFSAEEVRGLFARAMEGRAAIMESMKKLTKEQIGKEYGVHNGAYGRSSTKEWLMKQAFDRMLSDFYYGESFMWSPLTETVQTAYERLIAAQTDADIAEGVKSREAATTRAKEIVESVKRSHTDPQTLGEYHAFIREYGIGKLSDEQLAKYDTLSTSASLEAKKQKKQQQAVVKGVETPADISTEIIETKHTKKGTDLFVVRLSDRVERDVYNTLNSTAKRLGGYYSSFRGAGATPGFQFPTKSSAESFVAASKGETVTSEKGQKPETRAEKLRATGQAMIDRGEESLGRDRQQNTARRATMAAGAEANAAAEIAMGRTLQAIGQRIEEGTAGVLEDISARTEVETLNGLMRQAMYSSDRSKTGLNHDEREKLRNRRFDESDSRQVKYPYPSFHVDNIPRIAGELEKKAGYKLLAQHLMKLRKEALAKKENDVQVRDPKYILKVKEAAEQFEHTMGWVAEQGVADYLRVQRLGLTNLPLLRQAVREYANLLAGKPKVDPIKEAERKLAGVKYDGYFPTPPALAERMAEELDIKPSHRVLEPSAGKGSLIEAAIAGGARVVNIDALEAVAALQDILRLKGFNVVGRDFLEHEGQYDRIIMNPPFENGQDIEHVQHAYTLLPEGGKLVAIMSEGPFFRGDKKATSFREWLDTVGGTSEKLPEGSFKDSDRSTGVATRLVVIEKPSTGEVRFNKSTNEKIDTTGFVADKKKLFQYDPSQEFNEQQEALMEEVESLAQSIFGNKLNLRFLRKMATMDSEEVFGAYTRERFSNALAHFASISLSDQKDGNIWKTMGHEGLHFLRWTGAIPDHLWQVLEQKAKSEWIKNFNIKKRYEKHFRDHVKSDGTKLTEAEVQEALIEEAIAEALGEHVNGNRAKGAIAILFDKIKRFFDGARRWLNKEGFHTADDIIAKIGRGEFKQDGGVSAVVTTEGDEDSASFQAAYHGSPYKFDKFTLDHIGEGEGAQAYGWGLYFAGNKEVAEFYRSKLVKGFYPTISELESWFKPGRVIKGMGGYDKVISFNKVGKDDWSVTVIRSDKDGNPSKFEKERTHHTVPLDADLDAFLGGNRKPRGELYKVDIPDDSELLLWDKPLSEQSEAVKAALEAASDPVVSARMSKTLGKPVYAIGSGYFDLNTKARNFYDELSLDMHTKRTMSWGEEVKVKNDKAVSEFLNSHGIKGIKYLDGASRTKGEGHHNYVIFDDAAIKILDTHSNAQDSGVMFQRGGGKLTPQEQRKKKYSETISDKRQESAIDNSFSYPDENIIETLFDENKSIFDPATFTGAVKGSFSNFKRKLQERMQGFKDIQTAIEKTIGEKLPESENVYLIEELYSSRVGGKFDVLEHKVKEPITKLLADIQSKIKDKVTDGNAIDQVEAFMMALHAPERNAHIAEKNPKFKDGGGSGITDAEAAAIIEKAKEQPYFEQMKEAAAMVRKMLDQSHELRYSSGLISKESYFEIKDMYKNYFPLRGFQEVIGKDDNDTGQRRGKGYDVRGAEYRQAFGRKSRAANILTHSFAIAEEVIIRSEKNRVANTLLNLVLKYKNPDVWEVNEMEMKPVVNAETGLVEYRPQMVNDKHRPEDTVLYAKRKGKAYRIHLKDHRLGKAIRNMDMDDSGAFINMMGIGSRWIASTNTRYNPAFVVTNAQRDLIAASINLQQYDIPGLSTKVLKTYLKAAAGVYGGLHGKEATYWQKMHQEFILAGGKVAFNDMASIRDRQKKLLKEMKLLQGGGVNNTRRGFRALINLVGDANDTVENALRLATFAAARDAGVSRNVAASMAKNVTVNFNKRGEWGHTINSLFPFFNAGVQGTAVLFKALEHRQVQKVVMGIALLGFAMDMLNALWSPEDDDGELVYDKIPQWEKESNLIFILPKGAAEWAKEYFPVNKYKGIEYIKLTKPYGYRVFDNLGQNVGAVMRGALTPIEGVVNIGKSVANSFSPIDGGQGALNFIAPTVLDPLVDVAQNKDWFGGAIVPGGGFYSPFPDSQKAKANTSGLSKWAAESLNAITGGDKVTPGAVDVSPAVLDYYYSFVTGGMGRFIKDTAIAANRLGERAIGKQIPEDEKLTIKDIPIVRNLMGATSDYADKTRVRDRVQEIYDIKNRLEQYIETGDTAGAAKYREEKKKILFVKQQNMYDLAKEVKKLLKDGGEARSIIRGNTTLSDKEKTRQLNELFKIEGDIVDKFNNLYNIGMGRTADTTRPGK